MPDIVFKEGKEVVETREDVGLEHIPRLGDEMIIKYKVVGIDHKMVVGEKYDVIVKIEREGAIK